MTLLDIGLNLTNSRFSNDRRDVLIRARQNGVERCIITGTSLEASEQAIALCLELNKEFPGMLYSTAGVHPHAASTLNNTVIDSLKTLLHNNPGTVVAVGETGLDFFRNFSPKEDQIRAFELQIELAGELQRPLFLHERDSHETQYQILRAAETLPPTVIHCFTGNREALGHYLDLDFYVGITGWICDERRGGELRQLITEIPLNRLLIETDAPYLTPRTLNPKPVNNRNEPAYLPEIARVIAYCRKEPVDTIARASTDNAVRLFGLPPLT